MIIQASAQEGQKAVMQAIQQYIDRHNIKPGQQGSRDLIILRQYGVDHLYTAFSSSIETGLSHEQVSQNGRKYGLNQYRKRSRRTLFQIFKQAISDELLIILMIAAAVSVVVEYFAGQDKDMFWVDGVSIMVAVIVCTLVSTISNYKKQKQFDQLDKMTQGTYKYEVLRQGKRQQVHRSKIVPGDMIYLSNGIQIPADCILMRAVNVIANQSAITGETHQVYKNVLGKCMEQRMDPKGPTPLMISGANVSSGQGLMMAVVVGKNSRAGKNFQLIFSKQEQQQHQTALQKQLQRLASQIGRIGIIAAVSIFIVLLVRLIIQEIHHGGFNFQDNIQKMVNYLIIAVTVVVVSIPEGLPLAVTLTLAYSMKAMHKDKILVRKLQSCETMGGARYLCSDKTGTITQNKMTVMHVVNVDSIPISQFTSTKINKQYLQKLAFAIFHNSSALVDAQKGPQTEIALLKMARNLTGAKQEDFRSKIDVNGYFTRLPFDSNRKRMTTGLRLGNQDLLFMSGASEQILAACNSILQYRNNKILPFTTQLANRISIELQNMAKRGLRTVSIAYKKVDGKAVASQSVAKNRQNDVIQDIEKSGFTLLGVFGIEDPPRVQSKEAIKNCRKAGIKVIMVTGDNKITATNIAQQVGITKDGQGKIMQASQFIKALQNKGLLRQQPSKLDKDGKPIENQNKLKKVIMQNQNDQRAFQQIIDDLVVMARSKPQHKYILVDGINKLGHIVGVTGDGANDAPALMRADIGLAMGITGTQVAKNASDIIILDDRFDSIVRAVVWGRNVYTSIRRFLQFQLTVNIIAVCIVLISSAIIRQSVLASVQMLWVNLIMDSLAALALATQPPNHQQLLKQAPNSPDQRLITKTMLKHIFGQAIFQLIILLLLLFMGSSLIPESRDGFDQVIGKDLQAKYYNGVPQSTIADGKFYAVNGQQLYKKWFDKYHNYSRHFTFIFNTFVFLQVFNFMCCRRIKDQINIFNNICSSKLFWIIVFIIVGLQFLIITFMGRFFQLYGYGGLTLIQWVISVGIGALTLPVSLLLRLIPFFKPQNTKQIKKFPLEIYDQLILKSIRSTNRPYIKSATAYNHIAADPTLPFTKLSSHKASKKESITQNRHINRASQAS